MNLPMTFNLYAWIKAFHIIFMVAWFGGLFYIFRLFVYHVQFKDRPGLPEAYQIMEHKLLAIISYPAMALTILFGFILVYLNPVFLSERWFHFKLLGVFLLVLYQIYADHVRRRFKKGDYFLSERACRLLNEVPMLLLIGIVILVVIKP